MLGQTVASIVCSHFFHLPVYFYEVRQGMGVLKKIIWLSILSDLCSVPSWKDVYQPDFLVNLDSATVPTETYPFV